MEEKVQIWTYENMFKMPPLEVKCFCGLWSMTSPSSPLGIHAVCCPYLLRQDFRSFPLQASRRIPLHANTVPAKLNAVAYFVFITVVPKYSRTYLHSTLWSRENMLLPFCGWNEAKSSPQGWSGDV